MVEDTTLRRSDRGMGIVSKVKNSKTQFLLVGVLAVGLIFGVLSLTYAAETPLHDEAPGTVITFSGKEWIILEQMPNGETYILLKDPDYRRAFDPDDTNLFNPSDQNNIAYYLNTTFYQSLSQKALISDHSWDRVSVNNSMNDSTDYGNVTCKIGLISFREYQKYSSYYNGDMLLHSDSYPWWTRTPLTEYSWGVYFVTPKGFLSQYSANQSNVAVRPALYLKPGTLIDENKEVTYGRPDTPTNLSASSQSPNAVNLTWQAVNGVAGYRIYRDDNMIAETVSTTYTDDTVLPGMTYSYSISAYNTDDLESKRSAPVTVTTPPATPTGLCGSAAGRTVTLTWEGPGNPRYIVQRSVNGIDYTQVVEVTEESFTETNDLWGTTYYYRVAQKGQDGAVSAYSDAVQITTERVPAPTGLTAIREDNNIDLSWNVVDGVDTYIVERSTDGETWEAIATVTTTTYTDVIEDTGIGYLYRVRADGGNMVSDPSNVAEISPPISPPYNLQVSVQGKSVTLTWEASEDAVSYIIERSMDGISWEQIKEQSGLVYQEVAPRWEITYQYRVITKTAEGHISAPSDPVQVTIPSIPVPKNLKASVTENKITLTWDAVPGVNRYHLQRSTNGIFWNNLTYVNGTTYTDRDLEWDQTYYYRVKSVDGDQESDYTAPVTAKTEPKLMPSAPKLSYSVDKTNIKLSWDAQDVSGYRVYINDELVDELPGNATSYSFTGEAGQTYKIKVEAFNPYGTANTELTVRIGSFTTPEPAEMAGDVATNAIAVFGSIGGLLALSLALRGAGPLVDAARKVIGL